MVALAEIDTVHWLAKTFPELDPAEHAELATAVTNHHYPAGHIILREGDEGTTLYLLVSGEMDILVHAHDDDILVDTIGSGAYFGEMAFLGETTRTATIRTRTECATLELDESDFMPIARANPELLRKLLQQIIGHLRRNDQAVIAALNQKNRELEQAYTSLAEQEALRTEFITTLSHELRTPLTSIQGYLSLVKQNVLQGASLQAAMGAVSRNVAQMVGLTNDMLILYEMNPSRLSFELLDVTEVVIEALNAAREGLALGTDGAEKTAEVFLNLAPDLPKIYADRRGLTLALRAIIENAFKFDAERRPVVIRTFCHADGGVAISVRDEGVGMDPADTARIFDAFVRLEQLGSSQLFPGLGVGLTVARFMVEKHNGRILVDTAPGEGSTFTVVVPGE